MKIASGSVLKRLSKVLVLAMIVSIMSVMSFISVGALGENLVSGHDPSFETAAWVGGMQNTDFVNTGAASMQVAANSYVSLWVNDVPLKPSTQYTLSYYFKTMTSDYNKMNYGIVLKAGGNPVPNKSTSFEGNFTTFTKKSFTFNTPSNLDLKVDPYNNFGLQLNPIGGDFLVDDVSLVEVGPAPTPAPRASSVTINKVTDKTLTLFGKTAPVATAFTLKYGSVSKTIMSNVAGLWSLNLSKGITVGTKITLTGTSSRSIYVGATAPTVNPVTSKSKAITGKTYNKGVVTIKIGVKSTIVKASASGTFKLVLAKTLKKGSKFTVKVKMNGQTSPIKTVVVK